MNLSICNLVPEENLFVNIINKLKPRNVSITIINNKKYILKKDNIEDSIDNLYEYQFYKKNYKKIKESHMNSIIQIPIKYKICKNNIHYLFNLLDSDINNTFLKKIGKINVINIIQQSILALYYINHKLKYYHNDLTTIRRKYQIHNVMYIKNNINKTLKIDDLSVKLGKYRSVIIDFGLSSKVPNYKLNYFYNTLSVLLLYKFTYISEIFFLFILYYYTYKNALNIYQIMTFYIFFEKKTNIDSKKNKLINFDKSIFTYFFELL